MEVQLKANLVNELCEMPETGGDEQRSGREVDGSWVRGNCKEKKRWIIVSVALEESINLQINLQILFWLI